MTASNIIRVKDVAYYERPIQLRLPFRFGVTTLYQAPQGFLRVCVENHVGKQATGWGAEMLAPKWFDKDLQKSDARNFADLRAGLALAIPLYLNAPPGTAFQTSLDLTAEHRRLAADQGLNPLVAGFGPALIDRAVVDAVCRLAQRSFDQALRDNVLGMEANPAISDLAGFDWAAFLRQTPAPDTIHARHTVGLADPLSQQPDPVGDGLPETLADVVSHYRHSYYKLKLSGDIAGDVARLREIAAILEAHLSQYWVTLDGNEQFETLEHVSGLLAALHEAPALRRLCKSTLLLEQPLQRSVALKENVAQLAGTVPDWDIPLIIDESDAELDSFLTALARGYRGVSSKLCKGIFKSIVNAARCRQRQGQVFMTGEDLTTQAGLGVQQDLALVHALGLQHVERNGHHYVDGMGGAGLDEQRAFAAAHPDLYHLVDDHLRLRIQEGILTIGSLAGAGFGSRVHPNSGDMTPQTPELTS